ncbi:hypothetical protein Trydic_g11321 [Trypoxylus dichotomus]
MPADDLYWSPIDFESEESNNFYRSYIDPWDLENYAYIRQHLDSLELSSGSSGPEEQLESTSTFTYLPGEARYGSVMNSDRTAASNYAAIDEIDIRDPRDYILNHRTSHHELPYRNRGTNDDIGEYDNDRKRDSSLMYVYETRGRFRKIALPTERSRRTRSYSYSDGYEPINPPQQIYSKLEDVRNSKETKSPIYDDIKAYPTSTTKFGLKDLAEHYYDQWDAKIESINDDDIELWKITKILKTKKEKIPPILGTHDIINNNSDRTEEFANCFEGTFGPNPPVDRDHEKFTDIINKQVHTEYRDAIDVQESTTKKLRNIIKTLADRKAPGYDGITNTAIKWHAEGNYKRYN